MDGFQIFGGEPSEEMKAQMRAQHEQQVMTAQYKRTAWKNLLNELSAEQLIVLKMVIDDCTEDRATPIFMSGQISGIIQFVHGVCHDCGGKHDTEVVHRMVPVDGADIDGMMQHSPHTGDEPVAHQEKLSPETDFGQEMMKKYSLDDLRTGTEEEPGPVIGFVCTNCGSNYASIEDRMLRPPGPEGCGGCQQKAKWG